jgi:phage gp36-like protein
MQVLSAPIEEAVLGEKTAFSADVAAGATSLSVYNTQGYVEHDYIVVGTIGYEKAELLQVKSVTAPDTLVLESACSFAHLKDEYIQRIFYNKRKFYRSATEGGTYSHLSTAGSPVDIDVDNAEGNIFEDPDGTATSYYKATYYNTTTSKETDLSDSLPALAGDSNHYTSIYKIKVEAGFKDNPYIDSDLIDRYRLEAESEVDGYIAGFYQLPFSSIPKMIQHITTLLAAGNLVSKEYGLEMDLEISKSGDKKIQRAEDLLKKIQDGLIKLIDSTGAVLSMSSANLASCSNTYDDSVYNKGELFTLLDENFRMADPEDGNASTSKTSEEYDDGFE